MSGIIDFFKVNCARRQSRRATGGCGKRRKPGSREKRVKENHKVPFTDTPRQHRTELVISRRRAQRQIQADQDRCMRNQRKGEVC